jgi:hypothetical protein
MGVPIGDVEGVAAIEVVGFSNDMLTIIIEQPLIVG